MFNWFRTKPACPVNEQTREWLDRRWTWLEKQFGLRRLLNHPLILPNAEFFPDPFYGTEEEMRHVLRLVCKYMDVDPLTVELCFYEDEPPVLEEGSYQGSPGLFDRRDGRFRIWLEISNLADPPRCVATMAHELGHIHLLGHGRVTEDEGDHEPLTDLLTVYFGMGVFTANSTIRERYWQQGHYSGWNVGRCGYLEMPEYGYAFARYAMARGEDGSAWMRELRLDVRTAFKQAMRFLAAEMGGGGKTAPASPGELSSAAAVIYTVGAEFRSRFSPMRRG